MRKKKARGGSRKTDANGLTTEEEAFCQHYAINRHNRTAYLHAFKHARKWKLSTVDSRASNLLATGKVQARLTVLRMKVQTAADETFEISAERVLGELAAIAFAKPADYFKWGTRTVKRTRKDGTEYEVEIPYLDVTPSSELTDVQMKAVDAPELGTDKFGNTHFSLKMKDRVQALKLLGQHLGIFDGKQKGGTIINGNVQMVHVSEVRAIEAADDPNTALKLFDAFRQAPTPTDGRA